MTGNTCTSLRGESFLIMVNYSYHCRMYDFAMHKNQNARFVVHVVASINNNIYNLPAATNWNVNTSKPNVFFT